MSTSEKLIYYADDHDVDENMMTISNHAGSWYRSTLTGIVCRNMYDVPTFSGGGVASSNIKKLIKYYTDKHDVDEDTRAISAQGGRYNYELQAGITFRNVNYGPTGTLDGVASKKNNIPPPI